MFWEGDVSLDEPLSLKEGRNSEEAGIFRVREAWHRMQPAGRPGHPQALDHQTADTDGQTRQFGPKDLQSLSLRRKVLQIAFLNLSIVKKYHFK